MSARRATRPPRSKPGKHGTLYLYACTYELDAHVHATWRTWAYDAEHALDRWHASNDGGYEIVGAPTIVREN